MAPEPTYTFPHRRFVVTRLDAGVETNVIVSTPLPSNANSADDQTLRTQVYSNCKTWLAANPGVVVFVYGPSNANGVYQTDDDRIWDSRVNSL